MSFTTGGVWQVIWNNSCWTIKIKSPIWLNFWINYIVKPTGSKGQRLEQGTNTTINLNDYIVEIAREASQAPVGRTSSTLLGNATKGRLSRRYYRKLDDSGKETEY